jgi:hypothetical protein
MSTEEITIVPRPDYPRPQKPKPPKLPDTRRGPEPRYPYGTCAKLCTVSVDGDLGDWIQNAFSSSSIDEGALPNLPADTVQAILDIRAGHITIENLNKFEVSSCGEYDVNIEVTIPPTESELQSYCDRHAAWVQKGEYRKEYPKLKAAYHRDLAVWREKMAPWREYDRFESKYGAKRKSAVAKQLAELQAELDLLNSL